MACYKLTFSGKFKKDFKRYQNNPRAIKAVTEVLDLLIDNGVSALPKRMKAHPLIGNYKGSWECHVFPDLLIIWEQEDDPVNEIHLLRLGSHSELF